MAGAIERLTGRLSRSPSIAEIAAELKTTPEEVLEAMEVGSAYSTISLSGAPRGDEELDPLETIGGEDAEFERSEQRATLAPALERLAPREREILRMRFEDGLPQTQIAQAVGLSQMHVSRLIRKSLTDPRAARLKAPEAPRAGGDRVHARARRGLRRARREEPRGRARRGAARKTYLTCGGVNSGRQRAYSLQGARTGG